MRIFANNRLDNCSANPCLSKKGGLACEWLGNVDMHMYAKCDKKYAMWFKSYEHFH